MNLQDPTYELEQTKTKRNFYHKIPKSLALAVANKIENSTSATLLVYALISDRFNVTAGATKQCFDSNEIIQKRTGLSKVTVEKSISWLFRWKFLKSTHYVKWSNEFGYCEKLFNCSKKAWAFYTSLRSKGIICKRPVRIIKPSEETPSVEELGLEIKDKKNGLYSISDCYIINNPEDEDYSQIDNETSSEPIEIIEVGDKNYGSKLKPLNEIIEI